MPYIDQKAKTEIDTWGKTPDTTGELTYVLFKECVRYLANSPGKFQDRSEVVAALECAKREFQRRYLDDYEQMKLEQNGDVT